MKFEYFATNRIPVNSEESIKEYLRLCFSYLHGYAVPNEEFDFQLPAIRQSLEEGMKKIKSCASGETYEELRVDMEKLKDFNVTHLGHVGFAANIFWDNTARCFKLRLFYDPSLKEKNLDMFFEPLREKLTTGPKSLGLEVEKEIESSVEPLEISLKLDAKEVEAAYRHHIKGKLKYYAQMAATKIGDVEDYECGLDEKMYYEEDKARGERMLKKFKALKRYVGQNGFKDVLKQKADIFEEVRKKFSQRFKMYALETTAYGTFPYANIAQFGSSAIAWCGPLKSFLLLPRGLNHDEILNLADAEIFVRPDEPDLNETIPDKRDIYVVSVYPYCHVVPELNEVCEEAIRDDEMLATIHAHELGEVYLSKVSGSPPQMYDALKYLVDKYYRLDVDREEAEDINARHAALGKILVEMGYEGGRCKELRAYKSKAEDLMEKMEKEHGRLAVLRPQYRYLENLKESCEKALNELAAAKSS